MLMTSCGDAGPPAVQNTDTHSKLGLQSCYPHAIKLN